MDNNVFAAYSEYYDLLYKDKNYETETNYVEGLIKEYVPNASTILELGCGTGIHASKFAKKDFKVLGIDRSETMLQHAKMLKSKLPDSISQNLTFSIGDIRSFFTEQKFDIVIALFHVMSYMTSDNDLTQAIQTAKKHLNKNGVFIFDCWHGPAVLFDKPVSRIKKFENEKVIINRQATPTLNFEKKVVEVNFDISICDKITNTTNNLNEVHVMRYLFFDELDGLMKQNGLRIIYSAEWLTKNNLSNTTWNACYVCKPI
ncbi:MAG: class I SAM-dependent methyltransferase [Bacteroidota bacterium]|nr:class I SAM-dependent methyltransferase [Bacteroidota bacterium]